MARAKLNHTRTLARNMSGSELRHTSFYLSEMAADYIRDQAAAHGMSQALFLDTVILDHAKKRYRFPTAAEMFGKLPKK